MLSSGAVNDGFDEGRDEIIIDGLRLGNEDWAIDGPDDGIKVGTDEGTPDGFNEGDTDGSKEG